MIGVGVDFGTSNSTVALFDGERLEVLELESGTPIMPTATYVDRAFKTQTGQAAIDQYVRDNTGRTVELIPEVIGRSSILVGGGSGRDAPETLSQTVYGAPIDAGLKGRLFRGIKRLLGDPSVRRLLVFDKPYRPVALITPVLLRMRKHVASVLRGAEHRVYVGHPVNFEGRDPHRNKLALTRLSEACGYAGWKGHGFYPEPLAATLSYLADAPANVETVLAVDFGGGTLDLSVLRREEGGYRVLATYGEAVGGDHIDQALFRHFLFPLLGKGERWRRRGVDRDIDTLFPFEDFEPMLLNWAVTYMLNQNRYTTPVLDCVAQGGAAAVKFRRLRDFINHNLGYTTFQAIKDLKVALSERPSARLAVPEIDIDVLVERTEFEAVCAQLFARVAASVDRVLELAGADSGRVDMVVRTGGSSLIPAVRNLLEVRFPGRVVEHDPFTSVAAGLAIAAQRGERFSGR